VRINAGFFVFRREVLDWIEPGDELVEETFARLIERREVIAYPYEGFFGPMDTIKDRQRLEGLHESGRAPWVVDRSAQLALELDGWDSVTGGVPLMDGLGGVRHSAE
jgi:glucose-1-phosphate cytidylyltransferase